MTDRVDAKAELAPGDSTDAKGYTSGPRSGVVKYAGHMKGRMEVAVDGEDQYSYNMNSSKRGLFVLINNKNFDKKTGMNDRSGTDEDAANLYRRFKELEFEVHMFNNQKTIEMMKIMEEAAKHDHKNSDCFACAILSHGDEGVVYGTDGIVQIDQLVGPLKGDRCPTLVGKPKLFIIQACRGNSLDHGVEVADAESEDPPERKVYRIPSEADILYCYSTVPGYFSWRNSSKGSWFVQALCKKLEEHGKTRDFLWILTRVSREVAYEFESNASKEFMNKKKQVPQIVSMLTKDLYFKSKGTPV